MFDEVWQCLVDRRPQNIPARLNGYGRVYIQNQVYPGLKADASSEVEGLLLLDLNDGEIRVLDEFEGDEYERSPVDLTVEDGGQFTAYAYLVRPDCQQVLTDADWHPDTFYTKHLNEFIGK